MTNKNKKTLVIATVVGIVALLAYFTLPKNSNALIYVGLSLTSILISLLAELLNRKGFLKSQIEKSLELKLKILIIVVFVISVLVWLFLFGGIELFII